MLLELSDSTELAASKEAFATNNRHEKSEGILGRGYSAGLVPLALLMRWLSIAARCAGFKSAHDSAIKKYWNVT